MLTQCQSLVDALGFDRSVILVCDLVDCRRAYPHEMINIHVVPMMHQLAIRRIRLSLQLCVYLLDKWTWIHTHASLRFSALVAPLAASSAQLDIENDLGVDVQQQVEQIRHASA